MIESSIYNNMYETTLPIVGTASFIMGLTLILFCSAQKQGKINNKISLIYLASAMLGISLINAVECVVNNGNANQIDSFAYVVFAASIEMFLFYFAYVSMLHRQFVTKRRLFTEIALIAMFTLPPLFANGVVFDVLFAISLVFYFVKLILNVIIYRRYLRKVTKEIKNYFSRESSDFLNWINRTFVIVLTIGTVSLLIPLTNVLGLFIYSTFVFFSYLYLYVEILHNIRMFDTSMEIMTISNEKPTEDDTQCENKCEYECDDEQIPTQDKVIQIDAEMVLQFIPERQEAFDKWLKDKEYSDPDLTIDDIVRQLNITKNRLSSYINNDLKINYYDWLAVIRIEDAKKQLIEHPNRSISEIGKSVGIDDKSNFSRVFRRFANSTPTAYRANLRS